MGGVPCSINIDEVNAINAERLAYVGQLLEQGKQFVEQVYIPDLLAIASFYKDWAGIGGGLSNYLAYGEFPTNGYNNVSSFKFPRGAVLDRDLTKVHEVNPRDPEEIKEEITNSWYTYSDADAKPKHPWAGETNLKYSGPTPPYEYLNVEDKYSWIKTPRWKGRPMEVGPLARLLVGYAAGNKEIKEVVDFGLKKLDVPATALFSTLGRTAARGLETILIGRWASEFYSELITNIKNGDTRTVNHEKWEKTTWAQECKGVGPTEAPRGALSHWIVIQDGKIANYQLVVPTTWNASPRDEKGQLSSYESSLIGTPVENPNQPLEILRTVHSFDPCLACSVHLYDEKGSYNHHINVF